MEKTYNPALIQRTQRYMETHSISQNQFAAKVNLSSAALSSYLNQKYKGSVEAVERQLSEFFKLDEEAEAAAEKTARLGQRLPALGAGAEYPRPCSKLWRRRRVCHRPRPERCAVRSGGRRHGDLYGRAEPALHKNL